MPSENKIEQILRDHNAIEEGHFLLASGNHSGHYVQTARLMREPHVVDDILEDFTDELKSTFGNVDKILTAATGGITPAQQVGLKLRKTTIFAERSDANDLELNRGFELTPDETVLLVEDVVTTGGTLEELKELVEENGAEVAGVFVLINRSDYEHWHGGPLRSLLSVDYPVYSAEECPLCEDGEDARRPGTKDVEDETVTGRSA
jgi:orotate phosphoribosyltransferase